MTTITVQTPRPVAVPRGAAFGAWAFQAVIRAVERLQAARTARIDSRAQRGRIQDAAHVRRYAQQVAAFDARFAADLYSAADRHERFGR